MRTWTERKLALLATGAIWMLGSVACVGSPPGSNDGPSGGDGGSGNTADTGGNGGVGGSGAGSAACDAKSAVAEAAFAPTSGPAASLFKQVVATPKVVMTMTPNGLHRSTDGGDTWSLVDAPEILGKNVAAMAARGDEIFVTVHNTAIYRTTDGGDTWTDVSTEACKAPYYMTARGDELFALWHTNVFRWNAASATWDALADSELGFDVIESDGTYLYANSVYEPGVYRLDLESEGATWTKVEDLPEWGYKAFAFAGGAGFAANAENVFRSTDGGATWKPLELGGEVDVEDLLVAGGTLFAATSSGLRVSVDGGEKWTTTEMGPFLSGFALASDGEHVFAASRGLHRSAGKDGQFEELRVLGDSIWRLAATETSVLSMSQSGVLRTTDAGATWNPVKLPENNSLLSTAAPLMRDGKVFGLGVQSLLVSNDDGASFEALPIAPAAKQGVTTLAAIDDGLVVSITTGAGTSCPDQDLTSTLYVSPDGGVTWNKALNGFPTTFTDCYGKKHGPMINGLAQVGDALLATTWHSGTFRSTDKGASWTVIPMAEDIGRLLGLTVVGDLVLAASENGGVVRSLDGGQTWEKSGLDGLTVSSFASAGGLVLASVGADYAPAGGVFYSADDGASWSRVDETFGARVRSVAVQGDALLAGTVDQSTWSAPLSCSAKK